jgi:hypothetical protein
VIDWCCMCKKSRKSIDHLLLHYEVARDLWVSVFRLFEIEWVMSNRAVKLLASWSECNSCNFENCERTMVGLKDILFKTL